MINTNVFFDLTDFQVHDVTVHDGFEHIEQCRRRVGGEGGEKEKKQTAVARSQDGFEKKTSPGKKKQNERIGHTTATRDGTHS